ncbi:MAG: NADH-quinone oxidoreductase subunit NuoE [Candidatus Aminicenantes bacterium]|nr:NADH-quinone oxidoreductase subunit NuoE [Candidatus Aminicenantes bacterium]
MEAVNSTVQSYLAKHHSEKRALIAILQDIQAEYNYLPREALETVAKSLNIPLIDVIGVATFYRAFSLKPRGRHLVTVCLGTACHVRGGPRILSEFEKRLAVEPGETTPDNQFTLETVACLGCCAIGPVVVVDGTYHAHTTMGKVVAILRKYAVRKKGKK